jgi:hypothetical protein
MVTPIDMQQWVHQKTNINLSSQGHGNLYRFEEVLCVHEKIHERLKIRSTYKGMVGNLFHFNTIYHLMSGKKNWTTRRLNKQYHSRCKLYFKQNTIVEDTHFATCPMQLKMSFATMCMSNTYNLLFLCRSNFSLQHIK